LGTNDISQLDAIGALSNDKPVAILNTAQDVALAVWLETI
jgi:hypothetical protein